MLHELVISHVIAAQIFQVIGKRVSILKQAFVNGVTGVNWMAIGAYLAAGRRPIGGLEGSGRWRRLFAGAGLFPGFCGRRT